MSIIITSTETIENNIARAQKESSESMERLSTGVRFTRSHPLPAERAQSDALSSKMREMNAYKRNASDGLSLTDFADSNLSEVSNINIRMRELVAQSIAPAISDKERQFLFIEYQSLYDEMDRIASSANYNGISLLNPQQGEASEILIRVGSPNLSDGKDLNVITIENLDQMQARPEDLGLSSARDLLEEEYGVSIDDVLDNFDVDTPDELSDSFQQAGEKISGYRAQFGATTTRLNYALQSIEIAYENISATNSRVKDTDYATEITKLTSATILLQAGTSLLTQKQQLQSQSILSLIRGSEK